MTKRILVVTDEFEADVLEAYEFLRSRSERLAHTFLSAVEECLIFIEEFPAASPVAWEGRKALVPGISYSIYYTVSEPNDDLEVISVVACMHWKRHPDTWRRRLDR